MLKERFTVIYAHARRPSPHPVFVPRMAECVECGKPFLRTAGPQKACPGKCREQRAARVAQRNVQKRRQREGVQA